MTEFLIGCLVGLLAAAAMFFGNEARFERRATLRASDSAFAKFLLHGGLAFANLGSAESKQEGQS